MQKAHKFFLEECRYYLFLAKDLGYGDSEELLEKAEEVSKLLEAYSSAIRHGNFCILSPEFPETVKMKNH